MLPAEMGIWRNQFGDTPIEDLQPKHLTNIYAWLEREKAKAQSATAWDVWELDGPNTNYRDDELQIEIAIDNRLMELDEWMDVIQVEINGRIGSPASEDPITNDQSNQTPQLLD